MLSNDVWGENLIEYDRNKEGTVRYYDVDSVKKSSGTVKVWETVMYGYDDKSRNKIITLMKENNQCQDCERLSFSKSLIELRCRGDLLRIITSTEFDIDGNVLYTSPTPNRWNHIITGTRMEELEKRLCK